MNYTINIDGIDYNVTQAEVDAAGKMVKVRASVEGHTRIPLTDEEKAERVAAEKHHNTVVVEQSRIENVYETLSRKIDSIVPDYKQRNLTAKAVRWQRDGGRESDVKAVEAIQDWIDAMVNHADALAADRNLAENWPADPDMSVYKRIRT